MNDLAPDGGTFRVVDGYGNRLANHLYESADVEDAAAWARRYAVRTGKRCPVVVLPSGSYIRLDVPGRDRPRAEREWAEARAAVAAEAIGVGNTVRIVGEPGDRAWRGALGVVERVYEPDGRPNLERCATVRVEGLGVSTFAVRLLRRIEVTP